MRFHEILSIPTSNPCIRPAKGDQLFVNIIVKVPLLQVISMLHVATILALEYPLPLVKKFAIHRSIVLRPVLLLMLSLNDIMFYQVCSYCLNGMRREKLT